MCSLPLVSEDGKGLGRPVRSHGLKGLIGVQNSNERQTYTHTHTHTHTSFLDVYCFLVNMIIKQATEK
jgi:hypothetical protein